jgi:hypothetical protein
MKEGISLVCKMAKAWRHVPFPFQLCIFDIGLRDALDLSDMWSDFRTTEQSIDARFNVGFPDSAIVGGESSTEGIFEIGVVWADCDSV